MTQLTPICINILCENPCAHDGARFRPLCAACHRAGGARSGVVRRKNFKCENVDSRLGFTCVVNWDQVPDWWRITELDHKDGNHLNNTLENIQELCSICHDVKTRMNGDHKGYRY